MNLRSKWACIFSLQILIDDGWAYLWTLTTPDEVDLKELSQRWRKMIWNGFTPCVRVFEKHPGGHGYHVHFVTADRIDVNELRLKAEAAAFGRIHVRRIPGKKAEYVAKYLTKQRSTSPGVRLWACVGFEGCTAKEVIIHGKGWEDIKMVMNKYPAPAGYNFYARRDLARKKLDALRVDAAMNGRDPNYKPPFPALFQRWRDDPDNSLGKSPEWWAIALTQGMTAAAHLVGKSRQQTTQRDTADSVVDPQQKLNFPS